MGKGFRYGLGVVALVGLTAGGLYFKHQENKRIAREQFVADSLRVVEEKRADSLARIDSIRSYYDSLRTFNLGDTTVYSSDDHNYVVVRTGKGNYITKRTDQVARAAGVEYDENRLARMTHLSKVLTFPNATHPMDLISENQMLKILLPEERVKVLNAAKEAYENAVGHAMELDDPSHRISSGLAFLLVD